MKGRGGCLPRWLLAWVLMAHGRYGKAHALLKTLRASAHDVGYVSRESALLAAIAVFAKLEVTTRTAAIVKAQERLHRNL